MVLTIIIDHNLKKGCQEINKVVVAQIHDKPKYCGIGFPQCYLMLATMP